MEFPTIPSKTFYGGKLLADRIIIREIPEGSDDSELDDGDTDIDDPTFEPISDDENSVSDNVEAEENINSDDENSDLESQDEQQQGNEAATASKKKKKEKRKLQWSQNKTKIAYPIPVWKGSLPMSTEVRTPLQYFKDYFDDELLMLLVEHSNLYSVQKNPNKPLSVKQYEIEQFIGIACFMSIYKLPKQRMYWNSVTRIDQIADVMSVNRWEAIKRNLHICDNQKLPPRGTKNYDKLYKIRTVITTLNEKFSKIPMGQFLSIDEQIVPFKGKSSLKQYNPRKPRKWGYKIFVLADACGLMYGFEVYSGVAEHFNLPDIGASGNVVLRLAQLIPQNKDFKLYFDNWFNGIDLQIELNKMGICALGTVRSDRVGGCKFSDDKILKKRGRGSFEEYKTKVDGCQLLAVKWFDNKGVTVLSSYVGAYPCGTKKRWDRASKQRIEIQCPSVIQLYNKSMGGVDLLDSLLALYRITIRSKKWYHRFFFHFVDLAVVQAWLMYRRDCDSLQKSKKDQLPLLEFKSKIAQSLCMQGKTVTSKRGRPSSSSITNDFQEKKRKYHSTAPIPNQEIRKDQLGHFPVFDEKKGRCKLPGCKGIPKVKCVKCKTFLCFTTSSNCFYKFHNE